MVAVNSTFIYLNKSIKSINDITNPSVFMLVLSLSYLVVFSKKSHNTFPKEEKFAIFFIRQKNCNKHLLPPYMYVYVSNVRATV